MACTPGTGEDRNGIQGKPGDEIRVTPDWMGWSGGVVHPDAPAGGGGPGGFARPTRAQADVGQLPDAWQPGPSQPVPLEGSPAPSAPKMPPATKPRSLGTLKSAQSGLLDVEVDATIVADGTGGSAGAETNFSGGQAWTAPGFSSDGKKKIVSFDGKFTWKGTVTIQTLYAQGSAPNDVSCYGRGTTGDDVRARNITLGFHESCHRDDYVAYLKANTLPDPPTLSVGMSESDYNTALADFGKALKAYFSAMKTDSAAQTDEVGYNRSKWLRTGKCFVHTVP